jgi:ferredoxin-NADP reductase
VGTRVGDKSLRVVVKVVAGNAFVLTAYLTDRIKQGMQLWPSAS